MISLTIDGKTATVEEGTSVLEAARSIGADIPTLCYHEELTANSACRLCTVEVKRGERSQLTASCSLPSEDGMEIQTASERVLQGRKVLLELLVARCSGVEELRELADALCSKTDRLEPRNDDCILCGLCTAVCSEVMGARAIGMSGRGVTREVTQPFGEEPVDCVACGACAYLCPTGAIAMEKKVLDKGEQKGEPRKCRYMRMGMIPYQICPSGLQCWQCELDTRMEDTLGTHPSFVARPAPKTEPDVIDGNDVMPGRYYGNGHTWAELVGGRLRLGVDDFTTKLAGEIVDVEMLVEKGGAVKAGDPIWKLELPDGRLITMVAPISGTIAAINEDITIDPPLLRKSPYARGWVCLLNPSDPDGELPGLRFKDPAIPYYARKAPEPVNTWVGEEAEKLNELKASNTPWETLTQTFFATP